MEKGGGRWGLRGEGTHCCQISSLSSTMDGKKAASEKCIFPTIDGECPFPSLSLSLFLCVCVSDCLCVCLDLNRLVCSKLMADANDLCSLWAFFSLSLSFFFD